MNDQPWINDDPEDLWTRYCAAKLRDEVQKYF